MYVDALAYYIVIIDIAVTKVDQSEVCSGLGVWTVRVVESHMPVTIYGGLLWKLDDPKRPKDNTYQMLIPGTKWVLDASHGPKIGRGHRINECWNPALASVKVFSASKQKSLLIVKLI